MKGIMSVTKSLVILLTTSSFAWIANLAMHVGLSDMAIFRYARHARYGFFSAFGMYLGHYLAWMCAGIMGAAVAYVVKTPLPQLDSGEVAYRAAQKKEEFEAFVSREFIEGRPA